MWDSPPLTGGDEAEGGAAKDVKCVAEGSVLRENLTPGDIQGSIDISSLMCMIKFRRII
jgi:hypothetical protein